MLLLVLPDRGWMSTLVHPVLGTGEASTTALVWAPSRDVVRHSLLPARCPLSLARTAASLQVPPLEQASVALSPSHPTTV